MAGFTNQIQVSPIGVSHDISLFTEYMMTLVGKADKLDKITAIVKDNGRLEDVKLRMHCLSVRFVPGRP